MAYDDTGDPYYATGLPDPGLILEADINEALKYNALTPASTDAQNAVPWWASMVQFGITRAIDNTFPIESAGTIQGNTRPGTFAGANGQTYSQTGALNRAPTLAGLVKGSGVGGMSVTTLVLIAVVGYMILK